MDYFDDRDKAAKWLHDKAHQLSVKYNAEVGARIFAIGDKFAVGTVVTDYHSNQVFVANSINVMVLNLGERSGLYEKYTVIFFLFFLFFFKRFASCGSLETGITNTVINKTRSI